MVNRIWWTEIKFTTVDMTLHYDSTEQRFRFPAKRCFIFRFFGINGIVFYGKTPQEIEFGPGAAWNMAKKKCRPNAKEPTNVDKHRT